MPDSVDAGATGLRIASVGRGPMEGVARSATGSEVTLHLLRQASQRLGGPLQRPPPEWSSPRAPGGCRPIAQHSRQGCGWFFARHHLADTFKEIGFLRLLLPDSFDIGTNIPT